MIIISSIQFQSEEVKKVRLQDFLRNVSEDTFDNYMTYYNSNTSYFRRHTFSDLYIRADRPSELDIMINIWLIGWLKKWKKNFFFDKSNLFCKGLIWHEIKQIYNDGLREYLRSSKNIVNSTMNVLYLASFGMKYYTIIEVSMGKKKNRRINLLV